MKKKDKQQLVLWLGRSDSNTRMTESEELIQTTTTTYSDYKEQ